jgi:predicted nucleic acid-binding Zn ribbon protein
MPPKSCPNCGADVPPKARVCSECGADESTGWSDTAYVSSLDLPDKDFDHSEFVQEEFGRERIKPRNQKWIWWVTTVILILLLGFLFLH